MKAARAKSQGGFTLLGVVFVLAASGFLVAGGVLVLKGLSDQRLKSRTAALMDEARRSLFVYARANGRLPYADSDGDGKEDASQTRGGLPYRDLGVAPADEWDRQLNYEVNAGLAIDRTTTCATFQAGIAGRPMVWDETAGFDAAGTPQPPPAPNPFPVAAVILSGGPADADGAGSGADAAFDSVADKGDNVSGNPSYVRFRISPWPNPTFDDLLTYAGGKDALITGPNTLLPWLISKKSATYPYDWAPCQ